jgi:hypothetical protein
MKKEKKMAKRKSGSGSTGGGVPTNYGYFVQDGVYITFLGDLPGLTTGTVVSPEFLKGRKCQKTVDGWKLV